MITEARQSTWMALQHRKKNCELLVYELLQQLLQNSTGPGASLLCQFSYSQDLAIQPSSQLQFYLLPFSYSGDQLILYLPAVLVYALYHQYHAFPLTANDDESKQVVYSQLVSILPSQLSFGRVITRCVNKFKVHLIHFALKLLCFFQISSYSKEVDKHYMVLPASHLAKHLVNYKRYQLVFYAGLRQLAIYQ